MTGHPLCPGDIDEVAEALLEMLTSDAVTTPRQARVVIRTALQLVSGLDVASLLKELRRVTLILAAIAQRDGGQVRLSRAAVFGEPERNRVVHVDQDDLTDEVVLTLTDSEDRPSTAPVSVELDEALGNMFGTRGQRRD